jgi:hypothetical protein
MQQSQKANKYEINPTIKIFKKYYDTNCTKQICYATNPETKFLKQVFRQPAHNKFLAKCSPPPSPPAPQNVFATLPPMTQLAIKIRVLSMKEKNTWTNWDA